MSMDCSWDVDTYTYHLMSLLLAILGLLEQNKAAGYGTRYAHYLEIQNVSGRNDRPSLLYLPNAAVTLCLQ